MKTKVQFLVNENGEFAQAMNTSDVFAFFPETKDYPDESLRESYAHIGQHCACSIQYAKESRPATPEEYADLKAELESIGYDLEVIN